MLKLIFSENQKNVGGICTSAADIEKCRYFNSLPTAEGWNSNSAALVSKVAGRAARRWSEHFSLTPLKSLQPPHF